MTTNLDVVIERRLNVCIYLNVCVVVDVAGRDHVTDGVTLGCHFLFHQQRQVHNLEKETRRKGWLNVFLMKLSEWA